jgi:hypothetical protein
MAARRWRVATRLGVVALVWSSGLVLAALFVPAYTSDSTSGVNGVTITRSTLAQENGARAIVLVAVPVLACIVVLWAIRARRGGARWATPVAWAGVGLVAAEALVGILTIGAFILPAVILLAMAVPLAPGPPAPGGGGTGDVSAAAATGT